MQLDCLKLLAIFGAFQLSSCATRRIRYGKETTVEKRYMVYLLAAPSTPNRYKGWMCGGSILSEHYVLTSAACVQDVKHIYVIAGYKHYVPSEDMENDKCIMEKRKKVIQICVPKQYHLDYNKTKGWTKLDIALIKVESPFDFNDASYESVCSYTPAPIEYNTEQVFPRTGEYCIVLGWGHTDHYRQRDDMTDENALALRWAATEVISVEDCMEHYEDPDMADIIETSMICTHFVGNLDDTGSLIKRSEPLGGCVTEEQMLRGATGRMCHYQETPEEIELAYHVIVDTDILARRRRKSTLLKNNVRRSHHAVNQNITTEYNKLIHFNKSKAVNHGNNDNETLKFHKETKQYGSNNSYTTERKEKPPVNTNTTRNHVQDILKEIQIVPTRNKTNYTIKDNKSTKNLKNNTSYFKTTKLSYNARKQGGLNDDIRPLLDIVDYGKTVSPYKHGPEVAPYNNGQVIPFNNDHVAPSNINSQIGILNMNNQAGSYSYSQQLNNGPNINRQGAPSNNNGQIRPQNNYGQVISPYNYSPLSPRNDDPIASPNINDEAIYSSGEPPEAPYNNDHQTLYNNDQGPDNNDQTPDNNAPAPDYNDHAAVNDDQAPNNNDHVSDTNDHAPDNDDSVNLTDNEPNGTTPDERPSIQKLTNKLDSGKDHHDHFVSEEMDENPGICQNDHGGPLIAWRGSKEIVIGVSNLFKINSRMRCVGPYLYTKTSCNHKFIDCIMGESDPEDLTRRSCDDPAEMGFEIVRRHISWVGTGDGPAENERIETRNQVPLSAFQPKHKQVMERLHRRPKYG